ncbi:MAG: hypothetical protein IKU37_06775 [Candidatus Gastranaerophilales bacterium]|nr:hypothetical protein [Candidatus Gastranaerophilales bacterium]
MGLSASQARFLQLTARKSDVEFEVQQINFQRLMLSEKLTEASTKYQDAINNRKLTFSYNGGQGLQEIDISYKNYKNYMNQQLEGLYSSQAKYYLVSSSGNKLVVSSEEERDKMIEEGTKRIPISSILEAKAEVEEYQKAQEEIAKAQEAIKNSESNNSDESTENPLLETPKETTPPIVFYEAPSAYTISLAQIDLTTPYKSEIINDENGNPVEYYLEQEYTESDFLIAENLEDATTFQNALKDGIYYFATRDLNDKTGKYEFNIKGLDTLGGGAISEEFDKSDDAAAQAEYDLIQSKVQSMDKKLELKLDQLETERNAITTEMDSVKKVIEDNIEKSFNIFS